MPGKIRTAWGYNKLKLKLKNDYHQPLRQARPLKDLTLVYTDVKL